MLFSAAAFLLPLLAVAADSHFSRLVSTVADADCGRNLCLGQVPVGNIFTARKTRHLFLEVRVSIIIFIIVCCLA